MAATTPLLLLLDSVLSQDSDRIKEARTRIRQLVSNANVGAPLAPLDENFSLLDEVNMLLNYFPNVASVASTHDGSLPLHFAASIGHVEVASRILSQYRPAATTPNSKGKIPLHYAAREGRTDMVAYFLHATPITAEITSKKQKLALHFAAGDGHTDVVRYLLHVFPKGASLPSAKGKLPLHFAARWGHVQIASDLLFLYPEGVRCVDWDGSLPLHDAAREGQVVMSRFLIERYPIGLSIANIRGEIPLFSAVRSGNVDLVILYLLGWPIGGMHILKAVSADDCIDGWDWKIVELCLRGAIGNFSDCPLLDGKKPPAVCCPVQREDFLFSFVNTHLNKKGKHSNKSTRMMEACCERQHQKCALSLFDTPSTMQSATCSPVPCSASVPLVTKTPPTVTRRIASDEQVPRSKSPILEQGGIRSKKRLSNDACFLERTRKRRELAVEGDNAVAAETHRHRKFIALHASLACGASSYVLKCVMKKCHTQLQEIDERGQTPLHLAVQHPAIAKPSACCSKALAEETIPKDRSDTLKFILEDILKAYPEASVTKDYRGRLPLHVAIAARADFAIIEELVDANPSSCVGPVHINDSRFDARPPIYMATECDCDLSTTYLLLRRDPSVVYSKAKNCVSAAPDGQS